jgi:single-stranded-DNA-specific exonuclease
MSWILLPPTEPSSELIAAVGGHPLVARLLAQRGFTTPEAAAPFLNADAYTAAAPAALIGVPEAAAQLQATIAAGDNILVWGDFDVDGQTSTSLLVAALRKLAGDERIAYHVPNRFTEGHGIGVEKLAEVLAGLPPTQLLLTCDTGIADAEAVGYAKAHGMTVVITDHHDLTTEFQGLTPGVDQLWGQDAADVGEASVRRADAIVNPKFQPADDPLRTLPGVGVAYKLIQQLYANLDHAGEEQEFLDLVALGIVADVAEQVHDTRYLLQRGLEQLRQTNRIGLLALMDVAGIVPDKVDAESIGFQIGPRMNALGRLEDATVAVDLLTTRDGLRAGELAAKMNRLNQDRRVLTSQTTKAALDMIARNPKLLEHNGLVLAHPGWHAGIVGIVASRLVEEFGKPTVLLLTPPGGPARGSARSIPSVDIGASIAAAGDLLIAHGGHPGAAGVTLEADKIDAFRRELSRQIELHQIPDAPTGLVLDAEVELDELNLELAEELQRLAPFGNGNPAPRFLTRGVTIERDQRMGKDGTHRRLTVRQDDATQQVVWFNGADVEIPSGPADLAYTLSINEYKGNRSLQLMFEGIRATVVDARSTAPEIASARRGHVVHDLRGQTAAQDLFPKSASWYAEGIGLPVESKAKPGEIIFSPRHALRTTPDVPLIIWNAPPSLSLLHRLIEKSGARELYLCDHETTDDSLSAVLRQVAGMCKYALGQGGLFRIDQMAARLGTTESVIHESLLWLRDRGLIELLEWSPMGTSGDAVRVAPGDGAENRSEADLRQARLEEELSEVRARRRYYRTASLRELELGV